MFTADKRTVDISINDEVVSTAEITGTSRDTMTVVSIVLEKEPGIYSLKVSPHKDEDGFNSVCLDDIWISNDNVTFYSVILNYGTNLVKNLTEMEYGFDPAIGACLYRDVEFIVELNLSDDANWGKTYFWKDLTMMENLIEILKTEGDKDPEKLPRTELAYGLFKARGYN